jgi:uncharacterized protein YfdQ (DUF2303 family)
MSTEKDSNKETNDAMNAEYEIMLQTDPSQGLTDKQVEERLETFGRNGILIVYCIIA